MKFMLMFWYHRFIDNFTLLRDDKTGCLRHKSHFYFSGTMIAFSSVEIKYNKDFEPFLARYSVLRRGLIEFDLT